MARAGRTSDTLSMIMRAPGCTQKCCTAPVKSGLYPGLRAARTCCAYDKDYLGAASM